MRGRHLLFALFAAAVLGAPGASAAALAWHDGAPVVVVPEGAPRAYRVDAPPGAAVAFDGDGPQDAPFDVHLAAGAHRVNVSSPASGWVLVVPHDASEGGVTWRVNASAPSPNAEDEASGTGVVLVASRPVPERTPHGGLAGQPVEVEGAPAARGIPGASPGFLLAPLAVALLLRRRAT